MSRESFLLRTDSQVLDALRRWANDELRSTNAQLDFILRHALRQSGRLPTGDSRESAGQIPPEASPGEFPNSSVE